MYLLYILPDCGLAIDNNNMLSATVSIFAYQPRRPERLLNMLEYPRLCAAVTFPGYQQVRLDRRDYAPLCDRAENGLSFASANFVQR